MRMRWMGITGLVLIVVAVALTILGPRVLPGAVWGNQRFGMIGPGMMMGNQMMGSGMMNGGMMGSGMIEPGSLADHSQPFDLRFLNQMIMHHQSAVMSAQMMIADSQRAELRDLAQRIITTQQREIEQMRAWRREYKAGPVGCAVAGGGARSRHPCHDQIDQQV